MTRLGKILWLSTVGLAAVVGVRSETIRQLPAGPRAAYYCLVLVTVAACAAWAILSYDEEDQHGQG